MSTQPLKKKEKLTIWWEIVAQEIGRKGSCFFLFSFLFIFLRSACWEFTHSKRGKIKNWNGLIDLCWLAEDWPQQVKFQHSFPTEHCFSVYYPPLNLLYNISSKVTCSKKNQFKRNFTFRATLKLLFFIVFDPFWSLKEHFYSILMIIRLNYIQWKNIRKSHEQSFEHPMSGELKRLPMR